MAFQLKQQINKATPQDRSFLSPHRQPHVVQVLNLNLCMARSWPGTFTNNPGSYREGCQQAVLFTSNRCPRLWDQGKLLLLGASFLMVR